MITRLVLFGATGDLAGRFLFPALARGIAAGELPDGLAVVGAAPQDWDRATFVAHVAQHLQDHAVEVPSEIRDGLVGRLRYCRVVDLDDADSVARAVHGFDDAAGGGPDPIADAPVAVYLALPPTLFPAGVAALETADLPAGSRIVVEKPFGEDLAGAVALNALLERVGGGAAGAVFRVDHALAMPGLQDLLRLRGAFGPDGHGWDSGTLAEVEVLWEETIALEGRAEFFDRTGAVRDVLQNHLLQILALVAMEPPTSASESDLHAARLELLRSVRVHSPNDAAAQTSRARYTAGELADRTEAPDYAHEPGVEPDRATETFAELRLEIDRPRWTGTTFVLRAGKAMAADRKGVVLHLRTGAPPDRAPAGTAALAAAADSGGQVWIELEGPSADHSGVPGELVAYGRVLVEVLSGASALSVSGEEAEQTWRIVEPVLDAWAAGAAPLSVYPAGSGGPSSVEAGT